MKIAFNLKTMRPGCALLQPAFGCGTDIIRRFDSNTWTLSPEGLKVYEINKEQLNKLVEMVHCIHEGKEPE